MDTRDVVSHTVGRLEFYWICTESVIASFEKDRESIVVRITAAYLMCGVPP